MNLFESIVFCILQCFTVKNVWIGSFSLFCYKERKNVSLHFINLSGNWNGNLISDRIIFLASWLFYYIVCLFLSHISTLSQEYKFFIDVVFFFFMFFILKRIFLVNFCLYIKRCLQLSEPQKYFICILEEFKEFS